MKKRVYSTEFKSEAVRLSYQRENIFVKFPVPEVDHAILEKFEA